MSRATVDLALDVRSYERVVLMADPTSDFEYPEHWERPKTLPEVRLDGESVLVVDCLELSYETIDAVLSQGPRLAAFILPPGDLGFEKRTRSALRLLYPFARLWTVDESALGKFLMLESTGPAYDRTKIVDQRKAGQA